MSNAPRNRKIHIKVMLTFLGWHFTSQAFALLNANILLTE